MKNQLLYYHFSRGFFYKLKRKIKERRGYIGNSLTEKKDFLFDNYKSIVIRKMFELAELKQRLKKKSLRRKALKNKIFRKFYVKSLAERIRNELLLTFPELLSFYKRKKSWKVIRGKISYKKKLYKRYLFKRQRKLIRNVKVLTIARYPTYREAFDLRLWLNKTYFWLLNATQRQVKSALKWEQVKSKRDKIKNYFLIKNNFLRRRLFLLKKKFKLYSYFNKQKKIFFYRMIFVYFNFYKKLIFFYGFFKHEVFLKFYFFNIINKLLFLLKRTVINKILKTSLVLCLKELKLNKKKKYKIKRRIKRKLLFYYRLSKYKKKIYKLKVKMVNSNFFITLTDYADNVIASRSTGQVSENRKKKVKLSPYLVTKMMRVVLKKLRKLKIKFLYFFINTKINRHINNVMKVIKNFRYTKILKIFFSKPIAHHYGTRKPKLRRL